MHVYWNLYVVMLSNHYALFYLVKQRLCIEDKDMDECILDLNGDNIIVKVRVLYCQSPAGE